MEFQDQGAALENTAAETKLSRFQSIFKNISENETQETQLNESENKIKSAVKELIWYLFFLIVLVILSNQNVSVSMYYYSKVMADLFVNKESESGLSFRDITTVEDFWKYTRGPLLDGLYWNKAYNEQNETDESYIFYQNKMIGVPRLRQLRIHESFCIVSKEFKKHTSPCYPAYTLAEEDNHDFGLAINNANASKAWHFHNADEIDGFGEWTDISFYSGSGFIQDLPVNRTDAEKIIDDLSQNLWIRRGTRAVFIVFTVYNANTNLFGIIRLIVEFPTTGGAKPSWQINSLNLIKGHNSYTIFIYVVQGLFIAFLLRQIVEEFLQMYREGFKYIKEFWNIFDILLIMLCLATIAMHVMSEVFAERVVQKFNEGDKGTFINFLPVAFYMRISNDVHAITTFVGFVKVFKFIGFNKTMLQLSMTLSACAKDLAGFFIMFFIVFLAFTQLSFLLFGSQLLDFSTFMTSFFTLFRIVLGDFNFHQLEEANSILGPIFFILFVFFVFFVLINMFLAIINDTYSEIKSDVARLAETYIMSDYIRETYLKVISKLRHSNSKERMIRSAAGQHKNSPAIINLDDWKADLYLKGFTDQEIEPLFHKYDRNHDGVLDVTEQDLMVAELMTIKDKNNELGEAKDKDKIFHMMKPIHEDGGQEYLRYRNFVPLTQRVERMEKALVQLVANVDQVLSHMTK